MSTSHAKRKDTRKEIRLLTESMSTDELIQSERDANEQAAHLQSAASLIRSEIKRRQSEGKA